MERRSPKVVDLFCGAGGFSLGFHAAGCRIISAADVDSVAGETFRRNFSVLQAAKPPKVFFGDEGDLEYLDLDFLCEGERPDIVIGGPPCQGFSHLGRAKLDSLSDEGFRGDPRNDLYRRFLAAVEHWRPAALVMENVPGMLSVGGTNYADLVCAELAEIGYRTGYALLNAVWYGVPQFRERIFFLGIRQDLRATPIAPATTHRPETSQGYSRPARTVSPLLPFGGNWDLMLGQLPVPAAPAQLPAVTVRDALTDLPELRDHLAGTKPPRGDFRRSVSYRHPPENDFARMMRNWPEFPRCEAIVDHAVRRTPRDYETFRRMQHGDRYPQALALARTILNEEVDRLRADGRAPIPGTAEWKKLEKRFIPPYQVETFNDKWGKLSPDEPAWTVPAHLAKDSYTHIHYDSDQARMISIREAARLQSFPDSFSFTGNMGDCFRQIGNAVPPLVGRAVAQAVLLILSPVHP